jgi:hypothetical protein
MAILIPRFIPVSIAAIAGAGLLLITVGVCDRVYLADGAEGMVLVTSLVGGCLGLES